MSAFYHSFGLLQNNACYFHVTFCRFVESRGNNLCIYGTGHVGNFFRTSSINSIIMYTSGWLAAMALAMSFIRIVLPVLGCATISARWPLPMGAKRSTTRADRESEYPPLQSLNFSSGKSGVRCSNGTRSRTKAGSRPLILDTFTSGKYFLSFLGWTDNTFHYITVFRPNSLICDCET